MSPDTPPATGQRRASLHHIPELDGVRGLAILIVLLLHFHAPFEAWHPLGPVSTLLMHGDSGVDIFFVLSGFLITSILISTRGATNYFRAFYARRALRIFPLAFATIAAFYWIALPMLHRHGELLKLPEAEQVWYWLFLGNWRQGLGFNDGGELGHFWSLAIEEQFYLIFSLLARWLPQRGLLLASIGLAALSIALRVVVASSQPSASPAVWRITFLHLDPIALGALLACSTPLLRWAVRWRWALILAGLAGMLTPLPAAMGILAGGVMASGLVALATTGNVPLLRSRVLTSCGRYSFAMYVLEPTAFISPLARHDPHSWPLLLTALILGPLLTWCIGWLSWHLLEGPCNRLKARFPYVYAPAGDRPEDVILDAAG